VIAAMLLATLFLQAPAGTRTGAIAGQVVDAGTGKPVSAAIVTLAGAGQALQRSGMHGEGFTLKIEVPRVLTGGDGRFHFHGLPAGSFTVLVAKGGYEQGASGRRRPWGVTRPVVLTDAQRSTDVTILLWKSGAIAGRLFDESGEPAVGVQVRALLKSVVNGRPKSAAAAEPVLTDDRGHYRFSLAAPGEYMVVASARQVSVPVSIVTEKRALLPPTGAVRPGGANVIQVGNAFHLLGSGTPIPPPPVADRLMIYPPVFHPSALAPAQATVIALASGEERDAVDVQLQPVPTARVSGTVVSPSGFTAGIILRMMPAGFETVALEQDALAMPADANGTFTFPLVPAGQFSLRFAGPVTSGDTFDSRAFVSWTNVPITVPAADLDGVVVKLRQPLRISGRVDFQGGDPPQITAPRGMSMGITLENIEEALPRNVGGGATWDEGFTLFGYPGGRYLVRVADSPTGWMFKSAVLEGRDVSEEPFDFQRDVTGLVITFTDRWSGLGGSVQGAGAGAATVLVFPTDSQRWINYGSTPRRLKSARATAQGRFSIGSLPPGEYYAIAVPEEQTADWRDPKVLESLSRVATRLTIMDGEHQTIDLSIKEVRQ
jgi:hypothetical protein